MAQIAVLGLWHLGCVVSACLSQLGHSVTATDFDDAIVAGLQQGNCPIYEPGLSELIVQQSAAGRLLFTPFNEYTLARAEYAFITFDTPVDDSDKSDLRPIERAIEFIANRACTSLEVVLMSQVQVGTCNRLAERLRQQAPKLTLKLVYQPENLRLGEALKTFLEADAIVVGAEEEADARRLLSLYEALPADRLIMSWSSAEMVKHATNCYLATSISFINEVADLAEACDADIRDVVRALRLDRRVGRHAFLSPGPGFSGGTLGRDVQSLREIGKGKGLATRQLDATLAVNASRLPGIVAKLRAACGPLEGLRVALLGLTYKPGTSTLRRSNSLSLARLLLAEGCEVAAFDPQVSEPQAGTEGIKLCADPYEAAAGAAAVVVMTPWPAFREIDFSRLAAAVGKRLLLDVHNYLEPARIKSAAIDYLGTGIALYRHLER